MYKKSLCFNNILPSHSIVLANKWYYMVPFVAHLRVTFTLHPESIHNLEIGQNTSYVPASIDPYRAFIVVSSYGECIVDFDVEKKITF